jgi:hypothetical protein
VSFPRNSPFQDFSIANASGASEELFPEVPWDGSIERFIFNPNAAGDIWVNLFGGVAAANTAGSIRLAPYEGWSGAGTGQVNVIAAAGADITAGQR